MGFFIDGNLVGFFMLRGWDAGYEIPSYGIVIDQDFTGYGFAKLSLEYSKTLCLLRGTKKIMLKVHVDNIRAEEIYKKAGFFQTGFDIENKNKIYCFDLQ
jgi:ribosomal-protein-alanine N-acetyltransferase